MEHDQKRKERRKPKTWKIEGVGGELKRKVRNDPFVGAF